jgi:hypothetical protein
MKNDNYKYFKEGDSLVYVKENKNVYTKIFMDRPESERMIKLYHTYIFDRYLVREDGGIIYDALVLKNKLPLYDGKDFMLLSEFRRLKLKKLKRRLVFKRIFHI